MKIILALALSLLSTLGIEAVDADSAMPTVLPPGDTYYWNSARVEEQRKLAKAVASSAERLDALKASDNPMERGLAIFIMDQRGDLDGLIGVSDWLGDDRDTIPRSDPPAGPVVCGDYCAFPQTVSEYLRRTYGWWLGIAPRNAADLRRALDDLGPVDGLAAPWIRRLERAQTDESTATFVRNAASMLIDIPDSALFQKEIVLAEVGKLPPDLRWVVACAVRTRTALPSDSPLTDEERRALIESSAKELGGRIDVVGSPAANQPRVHWHELTGGMPAVGPKGNTNQEVEASVRRIAPDLIVGDDEVEVPVEGK